GLLHKDLIGDLYRARRDPTLLEASGKKALVPELKSIADELRKDPGQFVDVLKRKRAFLQANYQTCQQEVENDGHRFGEDLSDADKKALIAFMATL
ncbi:MAG: cytochrome c, partial [Pseudomonadota bacterium]